MGNNFDQDPKNVSKYQQCLSYASCDKMIKNSLCKVGLITSAKLHLIQRYGQFKQVLVEIFEFADTKSSNSEISVRIKGTFFMDMVYS